MPATTLGDQRWVQQGVNSAGDPVYVRNLGGGAQVDEERDYSEWTKDDLSAELERRGLPKSGNKGELIARLEEDDG